MKAGKLDDIGQITLPPSIFSHGMKDIVQRRLQRLSSQHQSLLKYAAIIGKEIHFDLLTTILGKFEDNNFLLKCVDADIFRFVEGRWYFSHDKLREGLIKTIPQEEYIQLNHQIATAISKNYANQIEYALCLTYHWLEGGEIRKAIEVLLANISELFRTGMLLETTPHIESAINAISDKPEFVQELSQLYFYLGKTYEFKGDYPLAHQYYQTGYEQATRLNLYELQINACIGLARIHRMSGEFREGVSLLQPLLANNHASEQQRIIILVELAIIYFELHNFDNAKILYLEALQMNDGVDNPLFTANIHSGLADIALYQGEFELCSHHTDIAHGIFDNLKDEFGLSKCLSIRQIAASFQGNLDEAIELAHQLMTIYERLGDARRLMILYGNLAFSLAQKQQYQASGIYFEKAIDGARELGTLNSLASRLGAYAQVQILLSDWGGARSTLYEWLCVSDYIQNIKGMIHGFYGMADLAIHDREFVRAGEYIGIIEANATPQNTDINELNRLNKLVCDAIGISPLQQAITKGKTTPLQDMVNCILSQAERIFGENYPNVIKPNHV
jgi:tetratricopeptide (TPR) repeat protein